MANPQIEQFTQALFWKAAPWIVICSAIGTLLRLAIKWLEGRATRFGQERQKSRKASEAEKVRRSQTAATGEAPRRVFIPSPTPAAPARSVPPPLLRRPLPPPIPQPLKLTLDDLSWENFELLAGEIFRRKGFEVEISSGLGADGGKDLTLRRDGELRLVQCKRFSPENKVSVADMREFYGLIVAENAKRGIFMTTGVYSRDAKEFAEGKPIKLLGRAEVEQLMASVARAGENLCNVHEWIRDFAAVANVTNPHCPRCRKPMKLRRGVIGRAFWGCSRFPRCRGKRNARAELVEALS